MPRLATAHRGIFYSNKHMSILQNIANAFAKKQEVTALPVEEKTASSVTTIASILGSRGTANTKTDPYGSLTSWVFFALDKIAQRVSATEFELFSYKGTTVERIEDSELLALLESPNHMQSGAEFRYLLAMYLKIHGRAPVIMLRPDNRRNVTGLFPARPDLLKQITDSKGEIVRYEYRVGDQVQPFNADDVIEIRVPSAYDPRKGHSALLSAYLEIDADINTAMWNKHLIENGAQPAGVLQTDRTLTDQGFERLKAEWENRYGGAKNAGKVAILEQGLKYQATSVTPKELDYIETSKFNRESILTLLGVPVGLVLAENVNKANAETAERVFAKETISPILRLITLALNAKLVPEFDESLWIESEEIIPADAEALRLDSQASTNVWSTVNETRSKHGLPPLEGGDILYLPFGLTPAMAQKKAEKGEPVQYYEVKVDTTKPHFTAKELRIKMNVLKRTSRKRVLAQRIKETYLAKLDTKGEPGAEPVKAKLKLKGAHETKTAKEIDVSTMHPAIKADRLNYLKEVARKTDQFRGMMRSYFDEMKTEVIVNVTKKYEKGMPTASEIKATFGSDDLFNWEAQKAKLKNSAYAYYKDNIGEGANAVAGLLGTTVSNFVETPAVQEFLRNKPTKLAEQINETTLNALLDTLADGVGQGEGLDGLVARIKEVFDIADAVRAETIARTEVGSAQNFGRATEMQEQGVTKRQWVSAFLNTREEHAEAHGQVVGVDEPFNVGGEELMYPQDPDGSAGNVINCQCSVAPVLE